MKILDAGTEPIPNDQVLDFIKRKRAQHARDDPEDDGPSLTQTPRPATFLAALDKHQAYLENDKFAYNKTPQYYDAQQHGMRAFQLRFAQLVLDPIGDKYRKGGSKSQLGTREKAVEWAAEEEAKELAETEMLGLYNATPACVEQLQTMIDNWAERYTESEMDGIQQALQETYLSGGDPRTVLATDRVSNAQVRVAAKAMENGAIVTNDELLSAVKVAG